MKTLFTIFFSLLTFGFFAQNNGTHEIYLACEDKRITPGDVLELDKFKFLQIEMDTASIEYELQIVVVPFSGTTLVFSKKESELFSMNIDEYLQLASIAKENIMHVIFMVKKNADSPELYRAHVFTRNLVTAADYFTEFKLYAASGDRESSDWLLSQALLRDPNNTTYQDAKAQFYFELKEYTAAKELFLFINETRGSFNSVSHLASIENFLGNYQQGKEYALKSLQLASTTEEKSTAYCQIGDAETKLAQHKSAYEAYMKSLKFNPKNKNALNNITVVLDEVGKRDEKVKYFQQLIDLDSSFYLVHVNIGFHYLDDENYAMALKEFNSVLEIDPNQALALSNKAYALMKLNRLPEAMEAINLSLQIMPSNSYAYRNKALILLAKGEKSGACLELQRALQLNFTQQYGNEVLELQKSNCN